MLRPVFMPDRLESNVYVFSRVVRGVLSFIEGYITFSDNKATWRISQEETRFGICSTQISHTLGPRLSYLSAFYLASDSIRMLRNEIMMRIF